MLAIQWLNIVYIYHSISVPLRQSLASLAWQNRLHSLYSILLSEGSNAGMPICILVCKLCKTCIIVTSLLHIPVHPRSKFKEIKNKIKKSYRLDNTWPGHLNKIQQFQKI